MNNFRRPGSFRANKVFSNSRPGRTVLRVRNNRSAYIHPDRFVNKAVAREDVAAYLPTHSFKDFALGETLQRNIQDHNYITPTPIQDRAIPPILEGHDLIGLANTGTGKTAAFLLPILQMLGRDRPREVSSLIVAPTRELAVQINEEFRMFSKNLGLYSALCVGGASANVQKSALARRPQVVIGTPGRLKDLVEQRALHLEYVRILVLDEADRMLDMGFIRDIKFLIKLLPQKRQSLCFSATLALDVQQLVYEILVDPVTISVKIGEVSNTIDQNVIKADSAQHKFELLTGLLRKPEFEKVLIFGQTKWGVQRLADDLDKQGFFVEAIHGNKSQPQRQKALKAFKENEAHVLVATDVAARGLDIPDVSHVINFDQPNTYEDYVHRIGRTGRAGKSGQALTFVS